MTAAFYGGDALLAVGVAAAFGVTAYLGVWTSMDVSTPVTVPEAQTAAAAGNPNGPVAPSSRAAAGATTQGPATLRMRFAGAGAARRVTGVIVAGDGDGSRRDVHVSVRPVGVGADAFAVTGSSIGVSLSTLPAGVVGLDLSVDPGDSPVHWSFIMDGQPWPAEASVAGGAYGLPFPRLRHGIADDVGRAEAYAPYPQLVAPATDLGLFITWSPER